MTLAEVIDTLQTWIRNADDEYDREEMGRVAGLNEALHEIKKIDMCEDAISRQAVLNILDDMVKDYINENDFDKAQGIAWVKVQKLLSVSRESEKEIYNKGFSDGQKALAEHLKLCKEELLDEIRAEIDEQYDRIHPNNIYTAEGLEIALDIIDKYKAESGDK